MCIVVILFRELNNTSVVNAVLKAVGYTYGPILGFFTFGLMTEYQVKGKFLPWICLLSPLISYVLDHFSEQWFWGYCFGFEILLVNGFLCFLGLWIFRKRIVEAI